MQIQSSEVEEIYRDYLKTLILNSKVNKHPEIKSKGIKSRRLSK